ncbi:MAG: hypothetical protein PHY77_00860 [Desulfotomaculaceae bacterium]|nr:hypothetical protein [Desulfotomaculaceae bacterium]
MQPTVQPAQTSQPEPVAQPVTVIRPAPIVPLTVKEGRKLLRSCLNTKETGAVHTALEQALPALLISQGGAASCA